MTSNRSNSPALVLPSRFNLHPALEAVPAQGCTISPRRRCNALRLWARQEGSKGRRTKIAVWYGPTALGEYSVAIRYILDRSVASTHRRENLIVFLTTTCPVREVTVLQPESTCWAKGVRLVNPKAREPPEALKNQASPTMMLEDELEPCEPSLAQNCRQTAGAGP